MKISTILIVAFLVLTGCGQYLPYPVVDKSPDTYPRPVRYNEIYVPPDTYVLAPDTVAIPADTAHLPCHIRPAMKNEILPDYPQAARDSRVSATMKVRAFVDEEGVVRKVRIIRCDPPNLGFEEAVISAVHRCCFYPARYYNRPVAVWYEFTITFCPVTGVERNPYYAIE